MRAKSCVMKNDIYDNLSLVPEDKKIAIWGICKERMDILTQTINAGIRISYFVDNEGVYDGERIFDKDVLAAPFGELLAESQIFVLVGPKQYEENKEWFEQYLQGRYYVVELGAIDARIKNSECVYIYGAGVAGRRTLQILEEQGVEVEGFIDSDANKVGTYCGEHIIFGKDVLEQNDTVVISTIYYPEVYKTVSERVNQNNIFIDYRNSRVSDSIIRFKDMETVFLRVEDDVIPLSIYTSMAGFYLTLLNDFCDKDIILYGVNELTRQVIDILDLLGIRTSYIVDDVVKVPLLEGYVVKNVFELAYEDMQDKMVLIVKYNSEIKRPKNGVLLDSGKHLRELGLKSFLHYRFLTQLGYGGISSKRDMLLDYCLIYESSSKEYPGFCVHGDEKGAKKKIVVLGGSTVDAGTFEHYVKSWPEYLQNKCKEVVIYNGGIQGYDSARECLKLLRDVAQLKPDLVISYSGNNDWYMVKKERFPFTRPNVAGYSDKACCGVPCDDERSNFWLRMQQYMKAISEVNGSKFLSILQPGMSTKEEVNGVEKVLRTVWGSNKYPEFVKEIKENMHLYDWMYDLTDAFDDVKEAVYRDGCHLNDLGNQIIADKIYDIINDYYMKTENERWLY